LIRWIDAIIAMTAYAYPRTMPLLGERGVESVTPTADTKHFLALIDKAERRPDAPMLILIAWVRGMRGPIRNVSD